MLSIYIYFCFVAFKEKEHEKKITKNKKDKQPKKIKKFKLKKKKSFFLLKKDFDFLRGGAKLAKDI